MRRLILVALASPIAVLAVLALAASIGFALVSATGGAVVAVVALLGYCLVLRNRIVSGAFGSGTILRVSITNDRFEAFIDDAGFGRIVSKREATRSALIGGISGAFLLTFWLYRVDAFETVPLPVTAEVLAIVSAAVAALGLIVAARTSNLEALVRWGISAWVHASVDRVNAAAASAFADLSAGTRAIEALGASIGVKIAVDYEQELAASVGNLTAELLRNGARLVRAATETCQRCREEKAELERTLAVYHGATKLLAAAETDVRVSGDASFLAHLDELRDGLASPDLKTLLSSRQYSAFVEVATLIGSELAKLRGEARDFQRAGRTGAGNKRSRSGGRSTSAMTEAVACQILGVPPTASPDQIKHVYRALAMAWHVDTGTVKDDTRMKEINAAYDWLRKAGRVR
ncbi:MAG: J domain-containing protein [Defluviicoccus sp.]